MPVVLITRIGLSISKNCRSTRSMALAFPATATCARPSRTGPVRRGCSHEQVWVCGRQEVLRWARQAVLLSGSGWRPAIRNAGLCDGCGGSRCWESDAPPYVEDAKIPAMYLWEVQNWTPGAVNHSFWL